MQSNSQLKFSNSHISHHLIGVGRNSCELGFLFSLSLNGRYVIKHKGNLVEAYIRALLQPVVWHYNDVYLLINIKKIWLKQKHKHFTSSMNKPNSERGRPSSHSTLYMQPSTDSKQSTIRLDKPIFPQYA